MKTSQFSMIHLFSDPTLTLVPLIFLNIMSVLIPSSFNGDGLVNQAPAFVEADVAEANRLACECERLDDYLQRLFDQEKALSTSSPNLAAQTALSDLLIKKAALEARLQELEKDIDYLCRQVPDPSDSARESQSRELLARRNARVRELKELEERLAKAHSDAKALDEEERERAGLTLELEEAMRKLAALLNPPTTDGSEGDGIVADTWRPTHKAPNYVELVGNRLFVLIVKEQLNDEVYEVVLGPGLRRKDSARGENITELQEHNGQYRQALQRLNPKEDALIFLVHKDSISAFRVAREVARSMNIEIGLRPFSAEVIGVGAPGSEETFQGQN